MQNKIEDLNSVIHETRLKLRKNNVGQSKKKKKAHKSFSSTSLLWLLTDTSLSCISWSKSSARRRKMSRELIRNQRELPYVYNPTHNRQRAFSNNIIIFLDTSLLTSVELVPNAVSKHNNGGSAAPRVTDSSSCFRVSSSTG